MLDETVMVPTEIVDHILGFLHFGGDYTTLETCSAIFPQLVEHHLYSQITIMDSSANLWSFISMKRNYVVDPTTFSLALIDRPNIANYVRCVQIFVRELPACGLAVVSSILSKLSQLKSIALVTDRHLTWDGLDPGFRTAFQNCIRLPSIEEVDISHINRFPINILDCCRNLNRLLLSSHCTGVNGKAISTSFYPRLCSLGVTNQTDVTITRIILSWMKSNTLHSLSLLAKYPMQDLTEFRTLIEVCSRTLVNLEFNFLHAEVVPFRYLPTPRVQLPLLERIIIRSPNIKPLNPRNYLSSLLDFVSYHFFKPSTHPIRLCLHFTFVGYKSELDIDWSDVAAFLVLPIVSHVDMYVKARGLSLADIISSFIQNPELKTLHEIGKLVIQ